MLRSHFPIIECLRETPECLFNVADTKANIDSYVERSIDGTEARFSVVCRGPSKLSKTCTATAIMGFFADKSIDPIE